MTTQYQERDHMAQGEFYTRHVDAMTGEGLHAKSAIAAELAHRDMQIEALRKNAERYKWLRDEEGALDTFVSAYWNTATPEALDAAIDAAMKGTP